MTAVTTTSNQLPAHLQGVQKSAKIGNIDSSDLVLPRVKLLQAVSPELDAFNDAKKGEFWHTIASQSLGTVLRGIPIVIRKSFVLWSPRGDDRGVLARANDGLKWDAPAGTEFTVKPKKSPHNVTYKLGETVHDRVDGLPALSEFGSSIPGDTNSPPAAALTYQILWYFPDLPGMSPAIMINTRSSVKAGKDLISKVDMRPVDHYAGAYQISIAKEVGDDGDFYNYRYAMDGYASEDEYVFAKQLFDRFGGADWKANDEDTSEDDAKAGGGAASSKGGAKDSKKF